MNYHSTSTNNTENDNVHLLFSSSSVIKHMLADELKRLILDAAEKALETSTRFSTNDIYRFLSIEGFGYVFTDRRGKMWEERTSLISPIRIRNTLLGSGYATLSCSGGMKAARYYKPASSILDADAEQAARIQIEIHKRTAAVKACAPVIEA